MPPSGLGIDFGDVSDDRVSPPRPQPQARPHLLKHQRSAPNLSSAASLRLGAESTQRIGGPSIITSIGISPSLMQAGFSGHGSGPQSAKRGGAHLAGRGGSRGGLAAAPKKAMGRSVRIASGEPGVLGHGAGHVDSTPSSFTPSTLSGGSPSDLASSSDSSPPTSVTSYSQGSASEVSVQQSKERREKLAAAVAIMQKGQGASPDTISSAVTTSPTDSASSSSSGAEEKKSSRKKQALRKHTSQPNFHGGAQMQRAQTQIEPLPPLPPAVVSHNMARSQSAIESASDTDSSRSSLFRSSNVQVRRPNQLPRMGKATVNPAAPSPSPESSSSATRNGQETVGSSVAGGSSDAGASTDRESASTQNTLTTSQLQQQFKVGGFYPVSGPVNQPALDHQARLRLSQSTSDLHGGLNRFRRPRAEMMSSPDITTSDEAASSSSGLESSRQRLRSKTISSGGDASDARSSNGSSVSANRSLRPMSAGTENLVTMRSARGMRGLEQAEHGGTMISLDHLGTGFEAGASILPEQIRSMEERDVISDGRRPSTTAGTEIGPLDSVSNVGVRKQGPSAAMLKEPHLRMVRSMTDLSTSSSSSSLQREATLLSASAHPARRSRELNKLLGSSSKKLADSSTEPRTFATINEVDGSIISVPDAEAVLEHDRAGKARVGLDLMLESDLIVEGGTMRGQIMLKIRKAHNKEGPIKLMQPKVRVVGFEELLGDEIRYIFFHQATIVTRDAADKFILHGSPTLSAPEAAGAKHPIYASPADEDGYFPAKEGEHMIPFSLEIPIGKGAKGSYRGKHAIIRYIAIASVKLKSGDDASRSIAHFYRHVDLYPYLNPAVVLSSAAKPITATVAKGLFMGGPGKVQLTATLHRGTWVAGQKVYVRIGIKNESSKKIKGVTLALVRTLTLFRPREDLNLGGDQYVDPDACATSTSRKKLAEDSLEMGQKGANGSITARGWWTGVEAGNSVDFSHSMNLPPDALSITRSRHAEVVYSIKVAVTSSMSSNVSVELPLRIINFVSLDPPPNRLEVASSISSGGWQQSATLHGRSSDAPLIERVKTMENLRSPSKDSSLLSPTSLPPLPADRYNLSSLGNSAEPDDQIARARRLQHQKSLDFIHHAIKSATARRGGVAASASESEATGLGIAIDDDMQPTPTLSQLSTASGSSYTSASSNVASSIHTASTGPMNPVCMPYVHPHDLLDLLAQQRSVDLDDADDSDEDEPACEVKLNDDSIDDIDFVLGAARAEDQVVPAFGLKPRSERQHPGSQERTCFEDDSAAVTSSVAVKISRSSYSDKEEEEDDQDGDVTLTAIEPAVTGVSSSEQLHKDDNPSRRLPRRESVSNKASGADLASRISVLPAGEMAQGKIVLNMPKDEASSSGNGKMRKKNSFSFTTADAPLKVRNEAGKGISITQLPVVGIRAKARAEQIVDPSKLVPVSAPSQKPHSKSSRRRGQTKDRKASHESTSSTSSPPALSDGMSSPTSSLAPHDSASMASSPASSVAHTPDSATVPLPIEIVDPANQMFRPDLLAEVDFGKKMEVLTRTEVVTTPQKPVARLRGSVSLANMKQPSPISKDDAEEVQSGLSHSSSTHNLRGAAVVVPSVRNKIAALENRQTTLRDFARGTTGNESDGSAAPSLTPKKSSASIGSTNSTPNAKAASTTPGRVAQLTASAEAASTSPSPSKGRSSGIPQSTSARQLVRKGSALSINSSTSSAVSSTGSSADTTPAYLKRQPSVLSFKAPVFKPAHVLKMEAQQQQ